MPKELCVMHFVLCRLQEQGAHPKLRSMTIWNCLLTFWKQNQCRREIVDHIRLLRKLSGLLSEAVLHPAYKGSSRAQWSCSAMTAVRLLYGMSLLVLHGDRRLMNVLLRLGPNLLHVAAAKLQENGGDWCTTWQELIKIYLKPIEDAIWGDPDTEREKGAGDVLFTVQSFSLLCLLGLQWRLSL